MGDPIYTGRCHCGQVGWRYEGEPEGATICNCTICRQYGVLWIYDYEGERIEVTGPTAAYARADAEIYPRIRSFIAAG